MNVTGQISGERCESLQLRNCVKRENESSRNRLKTTEVLFTCTYLLKGRTITPPHPPIAHILMLLYDAATGHVLVAEYVLIFMEDFKVYPFPFQISEKNNACLSLSSGQSCFYNSLF